MRDRRNHHPALFLCTVFLASVLALAMPLNAEAMLPSEYKTVAIAPLATGESGSALGKAEREKVHQALISAVERDGRLEMVNEQAVVAALLDMGKPTDQGCVERECLVTLGQQVGADLVLAVKVQNVQRGGRVEYEVFLVDVAARKIADLARGRGQDAYDLPDDEIIAATRSLLDGKLNPRGTLIVDTDPAESTVLLNGDPIGFAPITLSRPAGLRDTLSAVRQGYIQQQTTVVLEAGETRNVMLRLGYETDVQVRQFPHVHAFAIFGRPLDQASSNLDSRLSWGDGESIGARVDAGGVWRIGIGFLTFGSRLNDIDDDIMAQAGTLKDPRSVASLVHSNLIYYPNGEFFSPYIGMGVGALQRQLRHYFVGVEEQRETDFEAAWLFMLGVEGQVFGPVRLMVELTHVRALTSSDVWKMDDDTDVERALWERSFRDFESFTILRGGVGITF